MQRITSEQESESFNLKNNTEGRFWQLKQILAKHLKMKKIKLKLTLSLRRVWF